MCNMPTQYRVLVSSLTDSVWQTIVSQTVMSNDDTKATKDVVMIQDDQDQVLLSFPVVNLQTKSPRPRVKQRLFAILNESRAFKLLASKYSLDSCYLQVQRWWRMGHHGQSSSPLPIFSLLFSLVRASHFSLVFSLIRVSQQWHLHYGWVSHGCPSYCIHKVKKVARSSPRYIIQQTIRERNWSNGPPHSFNIRATRRF